MMRIDLSGFEDRALFGPRVRLLRDVIRIQHGRPLRNDDGRFCLACGHIYATSGPCHAANGCTVGFCCGGSA